MSAKTESVPHVYKAISEVTAELAKQGVSKNQTNSYDRYNFRGSDDVYNALAPLLAKHNLCVMPKVTARDITERTSNKGGALFYVVLWVEYTFVSSVDASTHVITVVGEAMDRGDKATNKAMSAAYKYACLQTFCIPTESSEDADAQSHEVAPAPQQHIPAQAPRPQQHSELAQVMADADEFATVSYWRGLTQPEQEKQWRTIDRESQKHLKNLIAAHVPQEKKAS